MNSSASEKEIALKNMNEAKKEFRRIRNKRILLVVVIIAIIFSIIKMTIGTIEIYNIFGYPSNRARFYKVTVNGNNTNSHYTINHKIPIIPYIININSVYLGNSYSIDPNNDQYNINGFDKVLINIESYSCFKDKYQVECKNIKQNMKKNNDEKFYEMAITRTSYPYEQVYSGEVIKDITSYVIKKGVYNVQIYSKRGVNTTVISFYLKRK